MASLVSTGLGSGLDIESLVTKLMEIEKQPLTALAKKEAQYQAKISAYGTLKGSLATFQTSVAALTASSAFNTQKASLADSSIAAVSATNSASSGSFSLEVDNLAVSQKLRTASTYAATTTTVGEGTLTIDFGTYNGASFDLNSDKSTKTITISSSQNTLSGVRDAINSAGAGVTAAIVNDGSGYRLMLTSNDTGTENELRIQTTGTLSDLAYDESGVLASNMTESVNAEDAEFTLDGVDIVQASNTVSDALEGVTFTLLKTNSNSPTTLTISRDTSNIKTLVTNFVAAYNTLKTSLNTLTAYNPQTKVAGALQGDATALSILSQLRSVFNSPMEFASGGLTTLTDIGVSFKKDGTLTLNTTTLSTALADTTKNIASLFTTMGKPTDSLTTYAGALSTTQPGNYAVNITKIASKSTLTGNAGLGVSTVITAGVNDALSLQVDGKGIDITLTAGTYTASELAAELQARVNGKLAGSGSVEVTSGTAAAVIGNVDLSAFTFPFSPATGNDTLDITIGATTNTISLSGTTFDTAADLVKALETEINDAFGSDAVDVIIEDGKYLRIVSRDGSAVSTAIDGTSTLNADIFGTTTTSTGTELKLTSTAYGSGSLIEIVTGTAAATLFGTILTGSTGYDVEGTINGEAATGFGQKLTSTAGDSGGLQINILGGATGDRGTINFDHGIAVLLNNAIDDITEAGGLIANRTTGLYDSIESLGDRSEILALRLAGIEKRYRAQFNALDALIASMTQTATFLEQQLDALSSSKKK